MTNHTNPAGRSCSWRLALAAAAALVPVWIASCNSRPARVYQPSINASRAGQLAMDQYDTNGDGVVAGDELEDAPGLKAALVTTDTNSDGGISGDEVAARIGGWQQMRTGLMSFSFRATLDGERLVGATVTFEPEEFLGDEIKAATCTTNRLGAGGGSIPKDQRPHPSTPAGMHLGLYKVRISRLVGGRETIPARYNVETVLGQEVAKDVPEILNNRVIYALTTK